MKIFKSPSIHRTPLYRVKAAYCGMVARCENANGKNPTYANVRLLMSLDEFITWALPRYTEFIANHPNESPCTARFGDKGHYEIGNIEVISMADNRKQQVQPAPAKTTHGTLSSYRYCHCVLCRAAKAKYMRERKMPR